jgi:uncharacterized protein YqjF (DUF2071 family)
MVSRTAEQRVFVPMLRASWETLTFVHWRVPPEQIQAMLPSGLTVDVYDGAAWVGLTPFVMANMRPLGVPDLAGGFSFVPVAKQMPRLRDLSSTPEINLRTYVRGPDGHDGLYFLSLDIGNPALAAALRAVVGAPYHYARLTVERHSDTVTYTGSRVGTNASYRLGIRPGEPIEPSEFEVWLTSRWRTYTTHLGRLLVTPVEHEPWPLREAGLEFIEENLTDTIGLDGLADPPLVHFSDGVHKVRVGRPAVLRNR